MQAIPFFIFGDKGFAFPLKNEYPIYRGGSRMKSKKGLTVTLGVAGAGVLLLFLLGVKGCADYKDRKSVV